jgi:hypothetical protein
MASIALTVIGPIDLLAYGTILTRVMFRLKKIWMFFPTKKAQHVCRGVMPWGNYTY